MKLKKFLIFAFVIINFISISQSYSIEPDVFVQSTVNRASEALNNKDSKEEKADIFFVPAFPSIFSSWFFFTCFLPTIFENCQTTSIRSTVRHSQSPRYLFLFNYCGFWKHGWSTVRLCESVCTSFSHNFCSRFQFTCFSPQFLKTVKQQALGQLLDTVSHCGICFYSTVFVCGILCGQP